VESPKTKNTTITIYSDNSTEEAGILHVKNLEYLITW